MNRRLTKPKVYKNRRSLSALYVPAIKSIWTERGFKLSEIAKESSSAIRQNSDMQFHFCFSFHLRPAPCFVSYPFHIRFIPILPLYDSSNREQSRNRHILSRHTLSFYFPVVVPLRRSANFRIPCHDGRLLPWYSHSCVTNWFGVFRIELTSYY